MLGGCWLCLEFGALLIPSHIAGVCAHSQVPLVPGERLGHHQLSSEGRVGTHTCTPQLHVVTFSGYQQGEQSFKFSRNGFGGGL